MVQGRQHRIRYTHKVLHFYIAQVQSEMPVGSGSRNGGGRDRESELSSQAKANGEEDSSNSDDDSTSCECQKLAKPRSKIGGLYLERVCCR